MKMGYTLIIYYIKKTAIKQKVMKNNSVTLTSSFSGIYLAMTYQRNPYKIPTRSETGPIIRSSVSVVPEI